MTKEELKLTSKEALERLEMVLNWNGDIDIDKDLYDLWVNLVCRTIEKDLDRLEKLEQENQELKRKVNYLEKFIEKYEKIPGMATTLRLLHNDFKHMFDNDFKDMFVNCKLTPLPDVEELKMTSQKALQLIRNYHNAEAYETYHDSAKNIFKRELDLIEKDLKILQMLKKNMSIKTDYYDDDMRHEYEYIAYNGMDLWIESEEELPKKELEKVGQMTYLQEVLIKNMNEFCSEKFDLSYERTREEANEYINKNIEEYRSLTTHNWY